MTENEGKVEEWMYGLAWKLRDETYDGIKVLDNKAISIINFSSILIPIITGVLFFISDKERFPETGNLPLIYSTVSLLLAIFFAFLAIWLRDVKIINLFKHFNGCDNLEIIEINGSTSKTIARWQEQLLKVRGEKIICLKISSTFFVCALALLTWETFYFF